MPTNTTYYSLNKPLGTENVNIGLLNANSDIIDTEMNRNRLRGAVNLAEIYDSTASYAEGDYCTYLTADGYKLYKCLSATTGAFDSTAWSETDIVSNLGSGGGGAGGGHEILDDGGTTLTQRDKMQFVGAYSEDNATDRITEVNVMRTMTRAEYEALPSAEKQGLIYVKDETTGTDDKFQPVIYSTEEREIGVWTDGKPLYQKTEHIVLSTPVEPGRETDITLPSGDIDTFAIISIIGGFIGVLPGTEITTFEYFYFDTNANAAYATTIRKAERGLIKIFTGSNYGYFAGAADNRFSEFYVTRQYTKTTDTAGSGEWTPQGVPAVHYSTDEQVIGTWIDGSILYERVFTGLSTHTNGTSWVHITDIDTTDWNEIIDCKIYRTNNNKYAAIPIAEYSGYVSQTYDLAISVISSTFNATITMAIVRYTKSS